MITLWNPTDETFEMQFEGRMYRLEPNGRAKVSEPCGKHLLTGFGQRGLTSLEYGDEDKIDNIRGDALELSHKFKLRQVVEYNQRNESRKQMNMPFLLPPDHIRKYAKDLNIELLAPFSVRSEENARIQQLTDLNEKLSGALDARDQQVSRLTDTTEKLLARLEALENRAPAEPPEASAKREVKGGKAS